MTNPAISILMPVYNTAPYLREAVDSVLAQTFRDFELIILDDCTPDESPAILDSYTDERIVRYRGKKNVGLANILNVGMDMARGKYVARMDSDDISLPNRLQVQYDYLEHHPNCDLVSVAMQQFGAGNRLMQYDNSTEEIKFNALFFSPILHASSMWRRERLANLRFEQSYVPAEDYRMWTKALVAGVTMRNIPEVLYKYRIFEGQVKDVSVVEQKLKEEYLKTIFPSLSELQLDTWCNLREIAENETDVLLACFHEMEELNKEKLFFEPKSFRRCYTRYYQAMLYEQMKHLKIRWRKLFRLRISQMIKLILQI